MSQAPIRIQNFIGGEFTDSSDNRTLNSINPATGEVLATVPESSHNQGLARVLTSPPRLTISDSEETSVAVFA